MSAPSIEQKLQEAEYEYPYHYLPQADGRNFTQLKYWSWGFRYLGGMRVVLDQFRDGKFDSLLDVGCGDGRFLREVAELNPRARLLGIDYSTRAIALARAMNPRLDYRDLDVCENPPKERFDVVTLIEVVEHIPPDDVARFITSVSGLLADGGRLIVTVPHKNAPLQDKHYQHFTSELLQRYLSPHFTDIRYVPFDPHSKTIAILSRLIGGRGSQYVLTNRALLAWFYNLYVARHLYAKGEDSCKRIMAICRR